MRSAKDADRFIEEVCSDDPNRASHLRMQERELEAGAPSGDVGQSEWSEPNPARDGFSEAS